MDMDMDMGMDNSVGIVYGKGVLGGGWQRGKYWNNCKSINKYFKNKTYKNVSKKNLDFLSILIHYLTLHKLLNFF